MGTNIFEFTHGDSTIAVYRDDHGMYRVIEIRNACSEGGERTEILLGTLREKATAVHLFNREVGRATREWELS